MRTERIRLSTGAAGTLLLVLTALPAAAQSAAGDLYLMANELPALIHACYVPNTGTIYRIKAVDTKETCNSNKHIEFAWNQQGIQGEKGDKGDAGEKGDKGEKGDPGEPGQDGAGLSLPFAETVAASGTTDAFRLERTGSGPGATGFFRKAEGDGAALVGQATGSRVGVRGQTGTGIGVQGLAPLSGAVAVEGHAGAVGAVGVRASAPGTSAALEIASGAIRVTGAGLGTETSVFIHQSGSGASCGPTCTFIDHPLTNNDPNAILFVTRRAPGTATDPDHLYVFYSTVIQRWGIRYMEDPGGAFTGTSRFNVMVIKP
jgi:hypothetical protein